MGGDAGSTGTIFGADDTDGVTVVAAASVTTFSLTGGEMNGLLLMLVAAIVLDCKSILLTRDVTVF